MVFSQNLLGLQTAYPVVTSNYVPGLRLEFADFKGRQVTSNLIFLLKIQILANFSYQAFIFTHFPIILPGKNLFNRHFKGLCQRSL